MAEQEQKTSVAFAPDAGFVCTIPNSMKIAEMHVLPSNHMYKSSFVLVIKVSLLSGLTYIVSESGVDGSYVSRVPSVVTMLGSLIPSGSFKLVHDSDN